MQEMWINVSRARLLKMAAVVSVEWVYAPLSQELCAAVLIIAPTGERVELDTTYARQLRALFEPAGQRHIIPADILPRGRG